MYKFVLAFILCLVIESAFAQIPNAGFENWETDPDSNYNPAVWQTTNSFPLVNVEPYSPGCQGNYAMKVKTLNPGFPFPGVAFLHVAYNFSQIPTRFSACVKSNIMPGDRAYIIVGLMRGDSVIASQDSCTFKIDSTISQFTYHEFPLTIQSNLIPDSLVIIVASGLGSGQVGTELIVDELTFRTGSTSVSAKELLPGSFSLHQNYPNPFNPSTTISYSLLKGSYVKLRVFNILGKELTTLADGFQSAGNHSAHFLASNMASGVYFYRLEAEGYTAMKQMLLVK
jgi:hypothetical protein